ncbi:MAG: hypothetical protein DCC68_17280 [Planctomycetota bacterium]|nr:MAG: hypothetical protein DCC68_17280 [Planctomycetota bacterium]
MRRFWKTSLLCAAVALMSLVVSSANAHVIYFSQQGPSSLVPSDPSDEFSPRIVQGGLVENTVPQLNLNVGDPGQLHVWINFDDPLTVSQRRTLSSIAFDIAASSGGLTATNFTMANPENVDSGQLRWNGVVGGSLNDSTTQLVTNARAAAVSGASAIGSHPSLFDYDLGHDDTTGGAYLGTLDFTAAAPGTYGLYFRTGELKTVFLNQTVHPLQYGNTAGPIWDGTDVGSGDPIDPGLTLADAIITVAGGGRLDFIVLGGDPAGGVVVPFTGVLPVDVPIGGPAGKIVVDPAFAVDSFFDVFFDVEFAQDASTDLAGLIALLQGQGLTVGPGRTLPSSGPGGIPYDFSLHIPAPDMGGSLVLDFDFGAMGTTGVSVNSVAVPEPSSVAIAALGLVGLLALRRRKA